MIEQRTKQDQLIYLSSQFSKLIKRNYGKGPDSCHITVENTMMVVYIRHFKTPGEEVLIEKKDRLLALKFRTSIMETIFKQFQPEVKKVLGINLDSFLHDWNFDTNTGIIIFSSYEIPNNASKRVNLLVQTKLENKLQNVLAGTYKLPADMKFLEMGSNIYVVESTDVLLPIEQDLYKKGYKDLLLSNTQKVNDNILAYKQEFNLFFDQTITDIFIVWDYQNNKNYLFFYLK